jgi:diguanylate cyclase (GGDEF)-like protein
LGRWGGEEFLLIVRDVTPKSLTIIAEKLRALIAQTAVPVGAEHLRITVSIGATLMADGDSDQTAIKRADELMYRSKTAGRNRVNIG